MRIASRFLLAVALLLVLAVGLQTVAAETGEVATIYVTDDDGRVYETRVWVVDDGGSMWIRGGSQRGGWSERASRHPKVFFERRGEKRLYLAVVREADAVRERVNALFAEKYGWRDTYISIFVADPSRERVRVLELAPPVP